LLDTFFSPASSISRGMYSSPSAPSWSVVWSLTVGKALTTVVFCPEAGVCLWGEACEGEDWFPPCLIWGVCTASGDDRWTGWDAICGLSAVFCLGGRPRFRGLKSSNTSALERASCEETLAADVPVSAGSAGERLRFRPRLLYAELSRAGRGCQWEVSSMGMV